MSSSYSIQSSGSQFEQLQPKSSYDRFPDSRSSQQSVYGQIGHSWSSSGLPTPPATREMTGISLSNHGSYPITQHYGNGYTHSNLAPYHARIPSESLSHSNPSTKTGTIQDPISSDLPSNNVIASHLQIPDSVNKSKGSLAEFAAEITCLFWFEDSSTLQYAKELAMDAMPHKGLVPDATPSIGFRKWVTTILSTTQVGKNVILLALMFIYRLKKFNPSVSGKRGSEFRLLTIALMLGNKFLDDNTYTNKTWAEVSGISVTEIHIMEVEFLSNMRYELYASKEEWSNWKTLLGKFGSFYEKAIRFEAIETKLVPPITPTAQTFNYKLPSPPSIHHNQANTDYSTLPHPLSTLPQLPRSPIRQYSVNGALSDRKRSLDLTDTLPPAKRIQYLPPNTGHSSPAPMHPLSHQLVQANGAPVSASPADMFGGSRIPQLPIPRMAANSSGTNPSLAPLSLPQSRAMNSVYAPTTMSWSQPMTPTSATQPAVSGLYQTSISPIDSLRASGEISSAHTSPTNLYGPSTPTRPGLSPSYFLTNRSSPYRPVRNVNTLLIPPPSAAMQNQHRNIDYQQMHYQPLGRPVTERRSGPVPYLFPDGRQQSNVSTPTQQPYRPY